jgi:hypothetical protein
VTRIDPAFYGKKTIERCGEDEVRVGRRRRCRARRGSGPVFGDATLARIDPALEHRGSD